MFRLFKKTNKEAILKAYKNLLKEQRDNNDEITNEQRAYDKRIKIIENKHNTKIDALLIEQKQIQMDLDSAKNFISKIANSNLFEK